MKEEDIKTFLKECVLFRKLNESQLAKMASISSLKSMPRKNLIFSEGEEATGFYVVVEGSVKLFNLSIEGKENILHIIESGGVFAESASFSGELHSCFAETKKKSVLIYIPMFQFKELLAKEPEIALKMLSSLSEGFKRFDWRVFDSASEDLTCRLAEYLLNLLKEQKAPKPAPFTLQLDVKISELASHLGTTSITLNRCFDKLKSLGIIEISGKTVTFIEPLKLFEISKNSQAK